MWTGTLSSVGTSPANNTECHDFQAMKGWSLWYAQGLKYVCLTKVYTSVYKVYIPPFHHPSFIPSRGQAGWGICTPYRKAWLEDRSTCVKRTLDNTLFPVDLGCVNFSRRIHLVWTPTRKSIWTRLQPISNQKSRARARVRACARACVCEHRSFQASLWIHHSKDPCQPKSLTRTDGQIRQSSHFHTTTVWSPGFSGFQLRNTSKTDFQSATAQLDTFAKTRTQVAH